MPKYTRNSGKNWTPSEIKQLRQEARENTPTRVIGLHLGRTETAVRSRASQERISLKPTNQSPYNRGKLIDGERRSAALFSETGVTRIR